MDSLAVGLRRAIGGVGGGRMACSCGFWRFVRRGYTCLALEVVSSCPSWVDGGVGGMGTGRGRVPIRWDRGLRIWLVYAGSGVSGR
jgi:hypothetical protein